MEAQNKTFFSNGNLKTEDLYDSITHKGIRKEYYLSGQLFKIGATLNHKRTGDWKEWDYQYNPGSKNIDNDAEFTQINESYKEDTLDGIYIERNYLYNNNKPIKTKIFLGKYIKGKRNGEWKRHGIYKNDSVVNLYINYKNDEQLSRLEWNSSERKWQYNEFRNGKLFGRQVEYHKNAARKSEGLLETIESIDSIEITYPAGIWVYWDTALNIIKSDIFEGYIPYYPLESKITIEFYKNKRKKSEGRYLAENEKKDGLWKEWDSAGNLVKSTFYVNGKIISNSNNPKDTQTVVYKLSNHSFGKIFYEKNLRQGQNTFFDEDNEISINFKNDNLHGPYVVKNKNGIICDGLFVSGRKDGLFNFYNDEHKVIRQLFYFSGRLSWQKTFTPYGMFIEKISYER
jgi:antitoxin component YwqK of YwqJK toxin-antitoxin module